LAKKIFLQEINLLQINSGISIFKKKRESLPDTLLYFKPFIYFFGLALPASAAFFAVFGAAFLALAFVAIFVRYI
jgi:hypothetical protein